MNCKKIPKKYLKLNSKTFKVVFNPHKNKCGIIYTLYSCKYNFLEFGFAEDKSFLENKLLENELILLDKRKGKKRELDLLINTLSELGIKYYGNLNFTYSNTLMRHLSILSWPVGRSLYKQRTIKKELSIA